MLKLLAILFVVGLATAGPILDGQIACAKETGSSVDVFHNYQNRHIIDSEDPNLKCMVKCTLLKESIVEADGSLTDIEAVADILTTKPVVARTREQILQDLHQCENSHVEGDACDKGFFVAECILKNRNRIVTEAY